ncbi:MAG TPA: hypothetical protein PKI19_06450 [Elusimicrobiales bacterium]|nr:hypothetical protein [Elusimicrobiales bacterium]
MEETPKKSGWKIFLYLTPLYILVAIPLVKWTMKNNSSEIALSNDEYSAFNSSEGEIKKAVPSQKEPDLTDTGYGVRYRSGGSKNGTQEEMDMGYVEGKLTETLGKYLDKPKAVEELFNNQWVIKGFMGRRNVKNYLANRANLRGLLEGTSAVSDFLADPVVRSAIGDPRVLAVLVDCDMAKTLLASRTVQEYISDPKAVETVVVNNPALKTVLRNPAVKSAIINNPQAAPLARNLGWKQ